jgi:hypothetical protein
VTDKFSQLVYNHQPHPIRHIPEYIQWLDENSPFDPLTYPDSCPYSKYKSLVKHLKRRYLVSVLDQSSALVTRQFVVLGVQSSNPEINDLYTDH